MKTGFFTRTELEAPSRNKSRKSSNTVSDEYLHKAGPEAVRGMNPKAKHPDMKPSGTKSPLIYVLGEAPSETDDAHGEPFTGKSGELLRSALPGSVAKRTRFDNVVRTHPPKGRDPKREEIEAYRKTVEASIERAAPSVIIAVGRLALQWITTLNDIKSARGKLYPVKIGNHHCWMVPVVTPAFLIRIAEMREDKVPGKEWLRIWEQDVARACEIAEKREPPRVESLESHKAGIRCLLDMKSILETLKRFEKYPNIGLDYETNKLRPYHKDSRVLSCALSNGEESIAFPVDHPEHKWTADERASLIHALRRLARRTRRVAHNLPFESEWDCHLLGEVFVKTLKLLKNLGCTLQLAFCINPGPPGENKDGRSGGKSGHALNDLCIQHFGFNLKGASPLGAMRDRLEEAPLMQLLEYNALDSKMAFRLYNEKLLPLIKKLKLEQSYKRQLERVVPVVFAQRIGMPIDSKINKQLGAKMLKDREAALIKVRCDAKVLKFEKRTGKKFNQQSNRDLLGLLRTDYGFYDLKDAQALTLEPLRKKCPLIDSLLELKSISKLYGTYIERFDPLNPHTYVYPDGRVHCQFGIAKTGTARLQSDDPNNQNWPRRKHKEVRMQLGAPDGYLWVSADQGQIEARVLAMESRDRTWISMLFDKYDVHLEWAEKLIRVYPKLLKKYKDIKGVRDIVKNKWVFPAFFGSSLPAIAANLEIPIDILEPLFEEFWDTFRGVQRWQQRKWAQYKEDGFVRSLTGRRRMAPLSFNMVINTPIQNVASDITVDAMVRLWKLAVQNDMPWLMAVLQVHDDLKFLVPKKKVEQATEIIVREQLGFKAPWLNVPLSVEVEVGPNLLEMKSIGKWESEMERKAA